MPAPLSVTLAPSSVRTTDGSGASTDGEAANRSAGVVLAVTVGSGGTLTVKIETSETGLDDWTVVHTFAEVTAPTTLSGTFGRLKRYIRAVWTISGGSFTFSVDGTLYSHLVTVEQLEGHMGARLVARLLDDSTSGSPNENAVNSILFYASSVLRGKLGDVEDLEGYSPETQTEIVRIGLDICQARAAIRHPEIVRMDGLKLMEVAKADLREIRLTSASLGSPSAPRPDTETVAAVVSSPRRGFI